MAKKEETTHTEKKGETRDHMIERIVIAACIVAIIFVVIFLVLNREDTYSVLYLKSYSNYVNGNVSFTYVVESHEGRPSSYNTEVLFQNQTIQTDSFQIVSGSEERTVSFQVGNDTQFPAEVEVITTVNSRDYSVHFWLLGSTTLVRTLTTTVQQPPEQQAVTTLATTAQQQPEQQAPPSTAMALAAYAPWALGLLLLFIIALFLARRRKKKRKKKSRK